MNINILVDKNGTIIDYKDITYPVSEHLTWYNVIKPEKHIMHYAYKNGKLIFLYPEPIADRGFINIHAYSLITEKLPEWKQQNLTRELFSFQNRGLTGEENLRKTEIERCFAWVDQVRQFSDSLHNQNLTENQVIDADWPKL